VTSVTATQASRSTRPPASPGKPRPSVGTPVPSSPGPPR
jgi:hypothetical protein